MRHILGLFNLTILVLITLLHGLPACVVGVVKLLTPVPKWQHSLGQTIARICQNWQVCCGWWIGNFAGVKYHLNVAAEFDVRGKYIAMPNHQSWVDILMFGPAFNYSAPPTKFFIKQEILWIPVIGFACWAGDMPFMKRYSKEKLAKHPELKGQDIETTRRSCAKFRDHPAMVVNFCEGTRFRPEKQKQQASPYANLLKPRAGGIAYAIQALEDQLDGFVDMDIIYGPEQIELWGLCCGRASDIYINVRVIPMQEWFKGKSYGDDPEYRERFQNWLSDLWLAKDQAISAQKEQSKLL